MNGMQQQNLGHIAYRVAVLLILVAILLGVVMWVFGCNVIPEGCTVWQMVFGEPKVLIVYGDDGLGDPQLLQRVLESRQHVGVRARTAHLDTITLGNLKKYQLVIVEHARTMSTEKMKMLVDYAIGGGRIVWTGDAGTELASGDRILYQYERAGMDICEDMDQEKLWRDKQLKIDDINCMWRAQVKELSPWARYYRDGDRNISINLDTMLNLRYIGNYCRFKDCKSEAPQIGRLDVGQESENQLIYGLNPNLTMYGDFAIVDEEGGSSTRVLSVDYGGNLISKNKMDLGMSFPVIVTAGMGERWAYYALPPEQFARPNEGELECTENCYYSLVENMYYGMLKIS